LWSFYLQLYFLPDISHAWRAHLFQDTAVFCKYVSMTSYFLDYCYLQTLSKPQSHFVLIALYWLVLGMESSMTYLSRISILLKSYKSQTLKKPCNYS